MYLTKSGISKCDVHVLDVTKLSNNLLIIRSHSNDRLKDLVFFFFAEFISIGVILGRTVRIVRLRQTNLAFLLPFSPKKVSVLNCP